MTAIRDKRFGCGNGRSHNGAYAIIQLGGSAYSELAKCSRHYLKQALCAPGRESPHL
jgi:hypothetical protein